MISREDQQTNSTLDSAPNPSHTDIPTLMSGDEALRMRFRKQVETKTPIKVGRVISTVPEPVPNADGMQPHMRQAAEKAAKRQALMNGLETVARETDYTKPYPQLFMREKTGIGVVQNETQMGQFDSPPWLWDPTIWIAPSQLAAAGTDVPYNPEYWDQLTAMLNPREVEEDIIRRFGEKGILALKEMFKEVAREEQSVRYLERMKTPMRIPIIFLTLWGDVTHSDDFNDFAARATDTLRKYYRREAFISNEIHDKPGLGMLYDLQDIAEIIKGVYFKSGAIDSDQDGDSLLEEIDEALTSLKALFEKEDPRMM